MNATLTPLTPQLDPQTGILKISFPGDILSTNAETLRHDLFAVLESAPTAAGPWTNLQLDLTRAQMVDSVGLNFVVSVLRRVQERNAALEVVLSSPSIRRTFAFTQLDRQIGVTMAKPR